MKADRLTKTLPMLRYPPNDYILRPPAVDQHISPQLQKSEDLDGGIGWPPPRTRIVGPGSSRRDVKAVERIVSYFMSETPWDFRPFCSSEGLEDVRVVLIFDEQYGYYALGAIGFRRIFHKSKPYWILNWAWFHPFIRGKSRLVKLWPALMQRFGKNFLVEFPVSHSMQAVLKKTGHMKRMNAFARSFEQSN